MVTRDRTELSRMAIACFMRQTYPNLELVVVDDGTSDYRSVLPTSSPGRAVQYIKLDSGSRRTLGELRNLSLDVATGGWWIQWDDDEWFHPERVALQLAAAQHDDADGSALRWTLMHVGTGSLAGHVFRADVGFATPGTILHRRTDVRYPALRAGEDSQFLSAVRREGRIAVLGREHAHLFIRCYHGANTWGESHFRKRLRRRLTDWPSYVAASVWRRDLTSHRSFRLTADEAVSASALLSDLADAQAPRSAPATSDRIEQAGSAW